MGETGDVQGGTAPPDDDPMFGCDALDVQICEAMERNPAISNEKIAGVLKIGVNTVTRRTTRIGWKKLWLSRHPPVNEVLDRLSEYAMRRVITAVLPLPKEAEVSDKERKAHEIRAHETSLTIVELAVRRGSTRLDGESGNLAIPVLPLTPEAAATLAAFIRSGGGVGEPGGGGATA